MYACTRVYTHIDCTRVYTHIDLPAPPYQQLPARGCRYILMCIYASMYVYIYMYAITRVYTRLTCSPHSRKLVPHHMYMCIDMYIPA